MKKGREEAGRSSGENLDIVSRREKKGREPELRNRKTFERGAQSPYNLLNGKKIGMTMERKEKDGPFGQGSFLDLCWREIERKRE